MKRKLPWSSLRWSKADAEGITRCESLLGVQIEKVDVDTDYGRKVSYDVVAGEAVASCRTLGGAKALVQAIVNATEEATR